MGVLGKFLRCFKKVSSGFEDVSRVFERSVKCVSGREVSRLFKRSSMGVLGKFQRCFKDVSKKIEGCSYGD